VGHHLFGEQLEVAVVLIDVYMPEIDGFQLATMIRNHPRFEKTALIFISAILVTDVDRLRGYEMGAVDYFPVPVVPEVLRAKVKVFVELFRKTRQLEQLHRELEARVAERTAELGSSTLQLRQSERLRSLALSAGQMGSWEWNVTRGSTVWDQGQCEIFGVDPSTFVPTLESVQSLIGPQDFELLLRAFREVTKDANTFQSEFRVVRPNGEVRWCTGTAAASFDESGRLIWLSGVTADITERKRAEERQILLAGEVDHRARNVLAVVQSIMRLTRADSIDDYIAALDGRIGALSTAHRLLAGSRWGAQISIAWSKKSSRPIAPPATHGSWPGGLLFYSRQPLRKPLPWRCTNWRPMPPSMEHYRPTQVVSNSRGAQNLASWNSSGANRVARKLRRPTGGAMAVAPLSQASNANSADW